MAQRKLDTTLARVEAQRVALVPPTDVRPLPAKAEAALRDAGLCTEQFVRQLAQLDRVTLDALCVLGAWDDLDWDDMAASFARMRHENPPAPSVEL